VDKAATEKVRRDSSVCMRGTTSIGASEERRARGGAWVCTSSLRYAGAAVPARRDTLDRGGAWVCTSSLRYAGAEPEVVHGSVPAR